MENVNLDTVELSLSFEFKGSFNSVLFFTIFIVSELEPHGLYCGLYPFDKSVSR